MNVSFGQLKYLVTVVSEDLLRDDFSNLENVDAIDSELGHAVSEEIYDKIFLLIDLLKELYKFRPVPF